MGEYYSWVNVDRKEYISPCDFDFGNKSHESMHRKAKFLRALRELLSEEWKGCHIFWMGDEKLIPKDTENETLKNLYKHSADFGYPENGFDTMCESYRNVSCFFRDAEKFVREEIGYYVEDVKSGTFDMPYNEYGIDVDNPFKDLFLREGRDFRFTINHSKKVCYSFDKTRILYQNGDEAICSDPLPILMGYGRVLETGPWVGDIIGVSDEMPEGYELLERIMLDW